MKRIYTIACCLLLSGMLLVGLWSMLDKDATVSQRENRALKTPPKLTVSGLLDGSFSSEFEAYYADTFPGRENLMAANRTLNGFYYFSGFSGSDSAQLLVGGGSNAADHGEALRPSDGTDPDPTELTKPTEPTEPSHSSEIAPPETKPFETDPPTGEQLGAVLLVGNRAMDVPYGDFDCIERYAKAVTGIADALGSDVRTFCIDVPNGAEFYTNKEYHTGSSSQLDMINHCYKNLGGNVIGVDAYTPLSQHADEYIYFRTDHHWTQLGAYYAYTAFCKDAGLAPDPLSKFQTGEIDNFVGSMYTAISDYPQSQVLLDDPDTLYYYEPYVDTTTRYYSDATLSDPYPMGIIAGIGSDVSNKYMTYLGGDHPITIVETDTDGPVCMILKESYGNAFVPWLAGHYSKIIAIDPREFNRDGMPSLDLAAFAKEQGVNDCIVLNYPLMLSSSAYVAWLERLVP